MESLDSEGEDAIITAFIWKHATQTMTPPARPVGFDGLNRAVAINDDGVAVGTAIAADTGLTHAARWANGKADDLNDLIPADLGCDSTRRTTSTTGLRLRCFRDDEIGRIVRRRTSIRA